eukprot:TRINITY_DN12780_c0_g1_i1.p1 TRINITY_DN12780_c0_g1~~TRINITY_DN12780_c0_g1_i1.p1  ORF type:complete len:1563 (+),score=300.46 TRINITY_DN12780_c0_g1_i1:677-4690(+)
MPTAPPARVCSCLGSFQDDPVVSPDWDLMKSKGWTFSGLDRCCDWTGTSGCTQTNDCGYGCPTCTCSGTADYCSGSGSGYCAKADRRLAYPCCDGAHTAGNILTGLTLTSGRAGIVSPTLSVDGWVEITYGSPGWGGPDAKVTVEYDPGSGLAVVDTALPQTCPWSRRYYLNFKAGSKFAVVKTGIEGRLAVSSIVFYNCQCPDSPSSPPTASPTASPRAEPTAAPKPAPTASPTASPRAAPTAAPKPAPTASPGAGPTASPKSAPTASPQAAPTASPGAGPTASPKATPTASPNAAPTLPPVRPARPTRSPASPPTRAPSTAPSVRPSASPVRSPSQSPQAMGTPTSSPRVLPTSRPTASPSAAPTAAPSTTPSRPPAAGPSPSASPLPPTLAPSLRPSATPTVSPVPPTTGPARAPTIAPRTPGSPSHAPLTPLPSARPSLAPSVAPRSAPTSAPSAFPTTPPHPSPSLPPSRSPSARPSLRPSARPSTWPSLRPSVQPSLRPTTRPSVRPSVRPSTRPSTRPSVRPSTRPSLRPTLTPSLPPSVPPSAAPIAYPSTTPTVAPSSPAPSAAPTDPPYTPVPSKVPSVQPTMPPSATPSAAPTSAAPTAVPTGSPTAPPRGPSRAPSSGPVTTAPTTAPTRSPSASTPTPSNSPSEPPSVLPSAQPSAPPTASPEAKLADVQVASEVAVEASSAAALVAASAPAAAQAGRLTMLLQGCTDGTVCDEVSMPIMLHPTGVSLSGFERPAHVGCVVMNTAIAAGAYALQWLASLVARKFVKPGDRMHGEAAVRFPSGAVIVAALLSGGAVYSGTLLLRCQGPSADAALGVIALIWSYGTIAVMLLEGQRSTHLSVYKLDGQVGRGGCARALIGPGEWLSFPLEKCNVERWGVAFRAAKPGMYWILGLDLMLTLVASTNGALGGGSCVACFVQRVVDGVLSLVLLTAVIWKRPYARPVRTVFTVFSQVLLAVGTGMLAYGYLSAECSDGADTLPGHTPALPLLMVGGMVMMVSAAADCAASLRSIQLHRRDNLRKALMNWIALDHDGDRKLQYVELRHGLEREFGVTFTDSQFKQMWDRISTEKSGTISLEEFLAAEEMFWETPAGADTPDDKPYSRTPEFTPLEGDVPDDDSLRSTMLVSPLRASYSLAGRGARLGDTLLGRSGRPLRKGKSLSDSDWNLAEVSPTQGVVSKPSSELLLLAPGSGSALVEASVRKTRRLRGGSPPSPPPPDPVRNRSPRRQRQAERASMSHSVSEPLTPQSSDPQHPPFARSSTGAPGDLSAAPPSPTKRRTAGRLKESMAAGIRSRGGRSESTFDWRNLRTRKSPLHGSKQQMEGSFV